MNGNTIKHFLPDSCPWQESILYYDTIDSTNTEAKRSAARGAPQGTVLIADRQTVGRGRLGRSFSSPGGMGVYLSVILRPNCPPQDLMHLTCATAVAVCNAVEQVAHFRPRIKWTNDLVYEGRKLCGILTELGLDAQGMVAYAIIGVGLNCCQKISDFPPEIRDIATSLAMVTGKEIQRSQVAASIIEALWRMDLKDISMDRYRADCMTLGREISLVKADGPARHGTALDVDPSGALIVRFSDGHIETVNSGEVSVRGMYGYV